jgi:hypothetical protein
MKIVGLLNKDVNRQYVRELTFEEYTEFCQTHMNFTPKIENFQKAFFWVWCEDETN